jgi:uncharacterized RDD family membrane protein YckC
MNNFNPYRPPNAAVNDANASRSQAELAGRGTRLGAILIDSLTYLVAMSPALLILVNPDMDEPAKIPIFGVVGLLFLALFIVNLVMLSKTGQSIGKRILNIKIVRTDGSRAGLGRIFWLRMFIPGLIGGIPLVGPIFSLVDPLFIFQESRRCIHDLIADTIVINA